MDTLCSIISCVSFRAKGTDYYLLLNVGFSVPGVFFYLVRVTSLRIV